MPGVLDGMWRGGVVPDERTVVRVANAAVACGEFVLVGRLFRRMVEEGGVMGAFSYSVLLKSHGRARNIAGVRSVVAVVKARAVPVDAVLFNSAIDALVRCADIDAAAALVSEPDFRDLLQTRSFNTLIKGFARKGMLAKAFQTRSDMQRLGCVPNQVTDNTLIAACVSAGDYERAWKLADQVAAAPLSDTAPLERAVASSPDGEPTITNQLSVALTSLLTGLAADGKINDARALLADMERRHAPPTAITYAALITACLRHRDTGSAMAVFRSIPEPSACNGKQLRTLAVYNAMVMGLCRLGDRGNVDTAAKLVANMLSLHSSSSLPGQPSASVRPTADTFNSLIDGFVRSGRIARAESYLAAMERHGCQPTIVSYTILLKGYGDLRNFPEAKRLFQDVSRRGLKPDRVSLNAFITVCARAGDLELASKVIDYMERNDKDLSPGVYSYTPLIAAYARASDLEATWTAYARMRKRGVILNAYVFELLVNSILTLGRPAVTAGWSRREEAVHVAKRCGELLRDAYMDGLDARLLRKSRRRMLQMYGKDGAILRKEVDTPNLPDIRSASETIFEKRGWNDIQSGWRAL